MIFDNNGLDFRWAFLRIFLFLCQKCALVRLKYFARNRVNKFWHHFIQSVSSKFHIHVDWTALFNWRDSNSKSCSLDMVDGKVAFCSKELCFEVLFCKPLAFGIKLQSSILSYWKVWLYTDSNKIRRQVR